MVPGCIPRVYIPASQGYLRVVKGGYGPHGAHCGHAGSVCTPFEMRMCTFCIDVEEERPLRALGGASSPQDILLFPGETGLIWSRNPAQRVTLHKESLNPSTPPEVVSRPLKATARLFTAERTFQSPLVLPGLLTKTVRK